MKKIVIKRQISLNLLFQLWLNNIAIVCYQIIVNKYLRILEFPLLTARLKFIWEVIIPKILRASYNSRLNFWLKYFGKNNHSLSICRSKFLLLRCRDFVIKKIYAADFISKHLQLVSLGEKLEIPQMTKRMHSRLLFDCWYLVEI